MESIKILLVDDEPEVLETIGNFFEEDELPYDIMKAPNGVIALKVANKKLPDLIITDWDMPEMDGIEFIKQLKASKYTAHIPIIMCTGKMVSSENLKCSLDAGAVDYIRKPIDKVELIARTRTCLLLADNFNKIKKINATKDKLFSIIAHDLLGPFTTILGLSDIVLKSEYRLHGQQEKCIKALNDSATRVYTLLKNLLMWANTQTENIPFKPEKCNIKNVIDEVLALFQGRADFKNIKLVYAIDGGIYAYIDINMIQTVLRNLISNAIKFTKRGGEVHVNAKVLVDNSKKLIIISVKDNGVGINKEALNNLLNSGEYYSTLGTDKEIGTGLGLVLCREFIERHNGKIWAESEIGSGSVFYFTLPF